MIFFSSEKKSFFLETDFSAYIFILYFYAKQPKFRRLGTFESGQRAQRAGAGGPFCRRILWGGGGGDSQPSRFPPEGNCLITLVGLVVTSRLKQMEKKIKRFNISISDCFSKIGFCLLLTERATNATRLNQRVLNDLWRTRLSCRRMICLFHLPLPSASFLSQSFCVSPVELTDGRGGGRCGRSQIIRPGESLVLFTL